MGIAITAYAFPAENNSNLYTRATHYERSFTDNLIRNIPVRVLNKVLVFDLAKPV